MKMFAKWSMVVVVGVLLTMVSGCQEEKAAPAAAEEVKETVTEVEALDVEAPAADADVEEAVTDVPMDHPAH